MDVLERFWRPEVSPDASILEIGCNAGTNLNRLREHGHRQLAGIEINDAALRELKATYPKLAALAELHFGDAETVLRGLPDNSFDVLFTMAVLLHVHPSSTAIFREMVRVARCYVCTIEAESALAGYVFPRNYGRVFARLGCSEVRKTQLARFSHPEVG